MRRSTTYYLSTAFSKHCGLALLLAVICALAGGCALFYLMPGKVNAATQRSEPDAKANAHYLAARLAISAGEFDTAMEHLQICLSLPEPAAAVYAAQAQVFLNQGKLQDAEKVLQEGIAQHPADMELRLLEARILKHLGRTQDAIELLNAALDDHPHRQELLEELSELHLQSLSRINSEGDLNKAIGALVNVYERMLEARRGYDRLPPLLILSSLYLRIQQPDKAQAAAEEAIEINPREMRSYMALGQVHEESKRPAEALDAYKKAWLIDPAKREVREKVESLLQEVSGAEGRVTFYSEMAKSYPNVHEIQSASGQALLQAERWGEAEAVFNRIRELWPDDVQARIGLVRVWLATDRLDEAVREATSLNTEGSDLASLITLSIAETLVNRGDKQRALEVLEKYQSSGKPNENVTLTLAMLLINDEQDQKAMQVLESFHREKPEMFVAAALLADVYANNERYTDAHQVLDTLPEPIRNEHQEEVLRLKAELFRKQKDYERATQALEELMAGNPENPGYYVEAGIIYQEMGRLPKAEALFKKAVELKPDDPEFLNTLAYFYAESGQKLDEALELVQRALELKPDAGHIVDSLGWVYYQQGEYQKSVEALERAAELMKNTPDAVVLEHLGDARSKLGDIAGARQAWQEASRLDADSASLKEKLETATVTSSSPANR